MQVHPNEEMFIHAETNRVTTGTVQKWRIQTHSSADIRRGFIYSKPSNSDWSIFFTISLLRLKNSH